MSEPLVIRPSSLTTYADCPRRWAARHLSAEIAAAGFRLRGDLSRNIGAAVGTGVHAGVSTSLAPRVTGATDLAPRDEAEGAAIDALRQETDRGVDWDDATPNLNTAEKQVVRMTRAWRASPAAQVVPFSVEKRLEVQVADGVVLSGQMDTVTRSVPAVLRDVKTGTRRRANGAQYGAYAMIGRGHGIPIEALVEDYIKRVPVAEEQPPPVAYEIHLRTAMHDAYEAIESIARDLAEFRRRATSPNGRPIQGAFRPNPASSLCGQRWCPAWGTDFCRSHA